MHQAIRSGSKGRYLAGLFVALLSLLAFVGSALAVQTHQHPDHRLIKLSSGSRPARDNLYVVAADDPCALCDALPAFESYIAPTAITFPAKATERFFFFIQTVSRQRVPMAAHDWQSRAPPRAI